MTSDQWVMCTGPGLILVGFGGSVVRSRDLPAALDYFNVAKRSGVQRIASVARRLSRFYKKTGQLRKVRHTRT